MSSLKECVVEKLEVMLKDHAPIPMESTFILPRVSGLIRSSYTFDSFCGWFEKSQLLEIFVQFAKMDRPLALWFIQGITQDQSDRLHLAEFFNYRNSEMVKAVISKLFGERLMHCIYFIKTFIGLDDHHSFGWKKKVLQNIFLCLVDEPRLQSMLVISVASLNGFDLLLQDLVLRLSEYHLFYMIEFISAQDFQIEAMYYIKILGTILCSHSQEVSDQLIRERHLLLFLKYLKELGLNDILDALQYFKLISELRIFSLVVSDFALALMLVYQTFLNCKNLENQMTKLNLLLDNLRRIISKLGSSSAFLFNFILEKTIQEFEPNISSFDSEAWINNQKLLLLYFTLNCPDPEFSESRKSDVIASVFTNSLPAFYTRPSYEKYRKSIQLKQNPFDLDQDISSRFKNMPFLLHLLQFLINGKKN
jgi:hypothetical protein